VVIDNGLRSWVYIEKINDALFAKYMPLAYDDTPNRDVRDGFIGNMAIYKVPDLNDWLNSFSPEEQKSLMKLHEKNLSHKQIK
jgi:hypothetical protein